jgi:hypothetical protein
MIACVSGTMVLGLKQGHRELTIRYVAQCERIHPEVIPPLGQGLERFVVGELQHDLRTQHDEGRGASRGIVQIRPVERIAEFGSEALRQPSYLLVDDADIDVHGGNTVAPAPSPKRSWRLEEDHVGPSRSSTRTRR